MKSIAFICLLCGATFAGRLCAEETFSLRADPSGPVFGPYTYAAGARIGQGDSQYELVDLDPVHFSLKSLRTGKLYGPFTFAAGARVTLEAGILSIVRERPGVKGVVTHPGLRPDKVTVHLLKVDGDLLKDYYQMVMRFRTLAKQYEVNTAPLRVGPIVTGPNGYNRSGLVERGDHDVERSRASLERQARPALEKFIRDRTAQTAGVASGQAFAFAGLEPGEYLVIAEGSALGDAPGGLVKPVYWWEPAVLDGGGPVETAMEQAKALEWADLFQRIVAVDDSLGIRVKK